MCRGRLDLGDANEDRFDLLDLPLAQRRGRTTERAVGGPGTGHAPARGMAVRVPRLERSICGLVVALLLLIQFHERWPRAEPIDDRLASATTGHTSLKLPTAQVRAVCDPLPTLARLAGGFLLGEHRATATTIHGSSGLLFL
jgi:hypothetical protein